MKRPVICNYGFGFSIAYVKPTNSNINEVDIHFCRGGIYLFEHIFPHICPNQRKVNPEIRTVASNYQPGKNQQDEPYAPLKISYYVIQKKSKDDKPEPLLVTDAADRPGMLHVNETYESERPLMEAPKPWKEDCVLLFERITEWPANKPTNRELPSSCRDWLRIVSPINNPATEFFPSTRHKPITHPPPIQKIQEGACVVVSARQLSATMRVRLQSSYEAMVVDLVRWWDWNDAAKRQNFAKLFGWENLDVPWREELKTWRAERAKTDQENKNRSDKNKKRKKGQRLLPLLSPPPHLRRQPRYVLCRLPGGALLIYGGMWRPGDETEQKPDFQAEGYLIFDRQRPAEIREVGSGQARGTGMFVAACVARAISDAGLYQGGAESFIARLCQGAIDALRWTTAFCQVGLACIIDTVDEGKDPFEKVKESIKEFAPEEKKKGGKAEPKIDRFPALKLDLDVVRSRETLWSIVLSSLQNESGLGPEQPKNAGAKASLRTRALEEEKGYHWKEEITYENFGRALLSEGSAKALFKSIPLVKFGKLELTDREEIQDYLAIQSILLNYLESGGAKPLNLGVFGPPGSGKSFGTKELLNHVGKGGTTFQKEPSEFNLSQFRSLDDLAQALHVVRDEGLKGKWPVAFFDEFDSTFQGNAYGWLQYLLAPMQDGKFWDNGREYSLGRCVLFFAGGVNRRFEEMNGRLRDPRFCSAKGPDFISRLRGVLNIKGVNKPDERSDQGRYLLRRAVLLRGMVTRIHDNAKAPIPGRLMDAAAANAFLSIDGFRHGNRSMEAILNMSHLQPGRTLRAADLPPLEQLEIHVDGKHFTEFVRDAFPDSGRAPGNSQKS